MTTRTLLLLACSFAIGCSSDSKPPPGPGGASREEELNEVAILLRSHTGKAPLKLEDLTRSEPGGPLGYAAIKAGEIIVVWGAKMGGEGQAGSDEVIAYEKKTPAEGGMVLLQNGKVKTMSSGEFAAAPKVKK